MRASMIGAAMALACSGPHPARAQGANYVDAVSRQVLLINQGGVAEYPDAVSRLVLVVNAGPAVDWSDAVSRQVVLVNAGNGYEVGDVLQALRLAAGMLPALPDSLGRLDPVKDGGSDGRVDVRDAARIARIVMGLAPGLTGHGEP